MGGDYNTINRLIEEGSWQESELGQIFISSTYMVRISLGDRLKSGNWNQVFTFESKERKCNMAHGPKGYLERETYWTVILRGS